MIKFNDMGYERTWEEFYEDNLKLTENINRLEVENKQLKQRVYELLDDIEVLETKIQNAIDYINNTEVYNSGGGKGWLSELDYFDLVLEILLKN